MEGGGSTEKKWVRRSANGEFFWQLLALDVYQCRTQFIMLLEDIS